MEPETKCEGKSEKEICDTHTHKENNDHSGGDDHSDDDTRKKGELNDSRQ